MTQFYIYLAAINAVSFIAFGIDKLCAKIKGRRISEKALLTISALGGALGAAIGMILFHHKTSKPRFRYSIPIFFFIYLFVLAYKLF